MSYPTLERLAARGRALAQRLKPQSAFSRNVLKLAGGTSGSQVITVAAAPILTRLYGPESFGVLATFVSILSLLNEVSSLRYELAIAVPEDDDEAIALVWLCFLLVAISTALTALGVVLLRDQLVSWLQQPALKTLLWLLPVGVFFTGVYQPLSYWAIRCKQFGLLAQTKFRQSIFGLATYLAAAPLGTIGLLLGQIVSQSAGFVAMFRESETILLLNRRSAPFLLLKTLHRYSHFGIYTSTAGLINMIGSQVPNLMFASAFGAAQLGQLALAQRLLLLPAGLIGGSVGQVFLSQAADRSRVGTLSSFVRQASKKLMFFGLIIALIASLIVAPMMPLLFGYEWSPTRWIIPLLCPLFLGQLIVSPLSMAFFASESTKSELYAQTMLIGIRLLPLIIAASLVQLNFLEALAIYSFSNFVGYVAYLLILLDSLSPRRS
ncbi:lipopolysaccharide biosynthesis protein [Synechococcus sp. 8F6]|uniref:lipopolysaccharide biosynthesis protein n=1 Tax=Synechococcus sp. 8F6 TaxID=2025606 RepID=UPI000B99025D|nr:oligosaccharide flippase family protein [Synechococcus sp. 8F6]